MTHLLHARQPNKCVSDLDSNPHQFVAALHAKSCVEEVLASYQPVHPIRTPYLQREMLLLLLSKHVLHLV